MEEPMDAIKLTKEYELQLLDLQDSVYSVDSNFTLYDLFVMMHKFEQSFPGMAAIFGFPTFDIFWEQINLDRVNYDTDIESLELYWHIAYDTRVIPMTTEEQIEWRKDHNYPDKLFRGNRYFDSIKRGTLSGLMGFHGIGAHSEPYLKQWPELKDQPCAYAIELSPLNDLKHLPIRLIKEVSFYQPFIEKNIELSRTGFILTQEPTLWCFITSIFWELTFFGYSVTQIAEKREELESASKEAQEWFKKEKEKEKD